MQLIGEPESTLDIEINMSTVENIQNDKTDDLKTVNLDIENFQDKKVNGNERDLDLNGDSKRKENVEEVISEIHDTSTDVPMNLSDNEVELNNADRSEILTNKNEEVNEIYQNGVNGLDSVQNDVMEIDGSKETEEDYLEDDIISIIEEPLKEAKEGTETDNAVFDKHVPIKEDVEDDKKEHIKIVEIAIVDVGKEEIKAEGNPEQCTTDVELQSPVEGIDSDHVMTESQETSPVQGEKETNMTTQEEEDTLRAIEKTDSVSVQNESSIPSALNDNDKIDESNGSHVSIDQVNEMEPVSAAENNEAVNTAENNEAVNTAENNEAVNTAENNEAVNTAEDNEAVNTAENNEALNTNKSEAISTAENNDAVSTKEKNETVNTAENNETVGVIPEENHSLAYIVSLTEQSKEDNIRIEDEVESTVPVIEDDNGNIDISEESEENNKQSNNIIDTEIDKETENTRFFTDTLVSPSSEARDIEIIEDFNTAGDQDENQKESHTQVKETENIIEPMEVVNSEKVSKTSKCDSNVQDSDTNVINTHIDNYAMDVEKVTEDTTIAEDPKTSNKDDTDVNSSNPVTTTTVNIDKPIICKLSNTLDILSDDDEELPLLNLEKPKPAMADSPKPLGDANNKCIDLEDDDDIMVIDEDTDKKETKSPEDTEVNKETAAQTETNADLENIEKTGETTIDLFESHDKEETSTPSEADKDLNMEIDIRDKTSEPKIDKSVPPTPLIPDDFVKTAKKKLSDMTRNDLEEFCILKIVESIIDRSSLSDIQNKLKCMTQGLEEYRKKAMAVSKQNRDLQLVLKSVQEEQKKVNGSLPITPLKITRSVGMQVYMEKISNRKKVPPQNVNFNKNSNNTLNKTPMPLSQGIRPQKQVNQPQNIPVPRLVPANNPGLKTPNTVPQINTMNTTPVKNSNTPNGIIKTPSPAIRAEKRQHNKVSSSMTVDLTDDEPPTKIPGGPKASPTPPVRLVPPQNLMAPQRHPFTANVNSPRKVYIPISGPQSQALRPGQTIMLKTVPATGIRPRPPQVARGDPNAAKLNRIASRHPAPLPCATKQFQPPNWKSLPPAPDLKLSKVENGIVISWKIESPPEESYEEIASYQLYAYQETTQPPSTLLWKKIGDVKALPLPMACTLTQFMAGFKYYFAVRAVDIRSRVGPFSLPGSILLLNKSV